MGLPDMSGVLDAFSQLIPLTKKTTFTVDFDKKEECVDTTISAVVQPAQKEDLTITNVDWSKSYVLVHSKTAIDINNEITWNGRRYKIVTLGNYEDYGYFETIGEEIK